MSDARIREIEERLRRIDSESQILTNELLELRSRQVSQARPFLGISTCSAKPYTPDEKIQLFSKLFLCRTSVYPKLWINQKQDRKGYAPACRNEWVSGVCEKPKIKCSDCRNQAFLPLDTMAIKSHLQGSQTIGTYAIREDDSCVFLAADFDGEGWEQDVLAYKKAAASLGVDAAVERSRSGLGAHAWIFFSEQISARTARQLGTLIVSRAIEFRHTLSLTTYDRFFPNQDYLPSGGFGNLIALPLQKVPRESGNSVFIDETLNPYPDQWEFLGSVKRISRKDIEAVLSEFIDPVVTLKFAPEISTLEVDERLMKLAKPKLFKGLYTESIEIELGAQLSVELEGLPGALVTALKRTATFSNPKFYELERMRFSTYPHPRFIFCGEVQKDHLVLPRGVLDECLALAEEVGANVTIRDNRLVHKKKRFAFSGELQPEQQRALNKLILHDGGILMAPPGAGKTVIACAAIAKRKVPTLVLVHRQPLLEQWKSQISRFLGVPVKEVGVFGGTKKKLGGNIDVAMIQSLTKADDLEELLSAYSQVIIDECHHIPAVSFESLLKRISAKYIMGLTATPYRKDGHHKILFMQCGQIRSEISLTETSDVAKKVVVRETTFSLQGELGSQPAIHLVWDALTGDQARNAMIGEDIQAALENGKFPLVISDRKEHLEHLVAEVKKRTPDLNLYQLEGTLGKKARRKVFEDIQRDVQIRKPHCLFSTASLVGEGVDLPHLDTLVLAMPISFKGRLIQYAGRLHRSFPGKTSVTIYDYLDTCSGLTISMYRKRQMAYRSMGYKIHASENVMLRHSAQNQKNLFELPSV